MILNYYRKYKICLDCKQKIINRNNNAKYCLICSEKRIRIIQRQLHKEYRARKRIEKFKYKDN
jgi:Zn finger protein HypA/HybF involved in hydrogenase expression